MLNIIVTLQPTLVSSREAELKYHKQYLGFKLDFLMKINHLIKSINIK